MVSCYIVILPSCHPVILSICKIFNLSSCHLVSLADIQFVRLSICQPVGLSACKLVSFSACTSWSFRACSPQQSTAQSYLDKAKNAKMAKNYLIGISIEIILGFGENGVQSAVASFCLLFVHFYKLIRPLASTDTLGGLFSTHFNWFFWGLSSAARSVDDFVSLKTPPYLHARVTSANSFPHMMMEMTFCSICTSICILCECPCGPSGTVLRQQIILKNTTFKKYWQKLGFRPNKGTGVWPKFSDTKFAL